MPRENLTEIVIGAAIEVHRVLGPGLLESAYEVALCRELELRSIAFECQVPFPMEYKGVSLGVSYRPDLIIENALIVEVKAVERLMPIHEAQLLTYLRLLHKKIGLLLNFHSPVLKDGIKRLIL